MSRAYQWILLAVTAGVLSAACRGGDSSLSRRTQEFEVVTEGSAAGVTTTVAAPGEDPTPLVAAPPVTGTNMDTTTSFAILDTVGTTATQPPGTLADTLPEERQVDRPRSTPRRSSPPTVTQPEQRPAPVPVPPTPQPPTESRGEEEEEEEKEEEEQEEENREEPPAPPPPTSTNPS